MAITYQEMLAQIREQGVEVSPEQVRELVAANKDVILLDVRESEEYREGHLPGAISLPRGFLELKVGTLLPDPSKEIVTYCAGGLRSLLATDTLRRMGYGKVTSMSGGWNKCIQHGYPTETPHVLTDAQRRRYARHLTIPEVGEKGQAKLLKSKVLLIGAGGLGSPAAYYLAAAGVGTLGVVDFDVVDESNLQRQILHNMDSVGTPKIESATKTLKGFSPETEIIPFEFKLDSSNIDEVVSQFDIVLDGSDNFPTRYLINDACVKHGKACVHGSVYRFEGQVTVFDPQRGGPCYRCLYPSPPPPEMAPSCADAGVLGVLPGIIGLLEAIEVIKLILDVGDPLIGRLLAYDGLRGKFREFKLRKDPACEYCGEHADDFPGYIDYEFFCANPATM
ncbi:molybdopterin-synthase adenylyltransferase MoeB [bacterium]|nr:molybdopterin-synthase adenylyltransferase MoeB [bacterium]